MTTAPGRAADRWARCGDALSYRTTTGAVVLPADGRTAVTLSGVEHAVWAFTAEPATIDTLAVLADGASVRSALARLSAAGIVRAVP
jgi:hypothetical protein